MKLKVTRLRMKQGRCIETRQSHVLFIFGLILFIVNEPIKVNGQLEAVGAVLSVVPVTSILATAGLVGVKLAALSRLLQVLGYDQAYLAQGGSGTAAQPIGLQPEYSYNFPYVPGLNISVRGENGKWGGSHGSRTGLEQQRESTRKTYPAMGLPGDYENQERPFRGSDTLRDLFKQAGLEMRIPTQQEQLQLQQGNGLTKQDAKSVNTESKYNENINISPTGTTPIYNPNSNWNNPTLTDNNNANHDEQPPQQQQQPQLQRPQQASNLLPSYSPSQGAEQSNQPVNFHHPQTQHQQTSQNSQVSRSPERLNSDSSVDSVGNNRQQMGNHYESIPFRPPSSSTINLERPPIISGPLTNEPSPMWLPSAPIVGPLDFVERQQPPQRQSLLGRPSSSAEGFAWLERHPIPQHEYFYRKMLEERQARQRPPKTPSFLSANRLQNQQQPPQSSGSSNPEIDKAIRELGLVEVRNTLPSGPINSDPIDNDDLFNNIVTPPYISDETPPYHDEMDHNEPFHTGLFRRKRSTSPAQTRLATGQGETGKKEQTSGRLAGLISAPSISARVGIQNQFQQYQQQSGQPQQQQQHLDRKNFGMPALNINPLRRRRRRRRSLYLTVV